jgi:predicted AAA+ superfamily ATPase
MPSVEAKFSRKPELLLGVADQNPEKTIIIDEVQKIPKILDVVHSILSKQKRQFILTGSSARKLKRGGANLLAGRALVKEIFPLTHLELATQFNLQEAIQWGTLPELFSISSATDKRDFLLAYAQTYLREEIAAEQLVRKIDSFRVFLEVAAQSNAKLVNASRLARDVGIDAKTVQSYFGILEDTHLGFFLEQYSRSARKRVMTVPKFYFFDGGVARALAGTVYSDVAPGTSYFGECFEHFVVCEMHRLVSYAGHGQRLFTLNSQDGFEIDLILETPKKPLTVCEIKSAESVSSSHLKNLALAKKDFPEDTRFVLLSNDSLSRREAGIECVHWKEFMAREFASTDSD